MLLPDRGQGEDPPGRGLGHAPEASFELALRGLEVPRDVFLEPGAGRTRAVLPAERGELVPEIRADIGVAECRPGGTRSVAPTPGELDAEGLVSEIRAEPVEADACERPRGQPGLFCAQVLQCLLEAGDVGGGLLVRIARALACVEPVQPAADRGEPCPSARTLELVESRCERGMLRSVQRTRDVSRARGEVELVGGTGVCVTQQARAHFR